MNNPGYFSVIPAEVRYCKSLKPNAKLLYSEISALCNQEGFCWADNGYFAELYEVNNKTISRWISQLEEYGFINVEILKSKGNARKITLSFNPKFLKTPSDKKVTTSCQKDRHLVTKKSLPSDKKVTSYIRNNNTINNTKNKRETRALDFYEKNYPSQWETFLMNHKSKIKDFQKFCDDFNDAFDIEQLDYNDRVIRARLNKYARNWIVNQNNSRFKDPEQTQQPTYRKKVS